jgi:dienelactone hydrolase
MEDAMGILGSRILTLCLSLVVSACAAAAVASADEMETRRQALEPYFHTYRPDGPGPFPAVLFVSGCLGFDYGSGPKTFAEMAESWRAKGYVVVYVDYLKARGEKQCAGESPGDVAKDILAVTSYLQAQSFIKSSEVTAIGWSLGGGAVLEILDEIGSGERSPLRSVIAYTPVCGILEPWDNKVPALVLMGANDKVASPAGCQDVFARLPSGTPLVARVYPDAGHVFNIPDAPGYNAAAAAAAAQEVDQFMKRAN